MPPLYAEYHHIKLKVLYPELAKDPNNIVCFTAYEHIMAHKYLALWYKDEYGENSNHYQKAVCAYNKVTLKNNGRDLIDITDELAAQLRIEFSKINSLMHKGIPTWNPKGLTPWNKGKKCLNLSLAMKGFKHTEQTRKATSER